jgi:hypothetical protein
VAYVIFRELTLPLLPITGHLWETELGRSPIVGTGLGTANGQLDRVSEVRDGASLEVAKLPNREPLGWADGFLYNFLHG